MSVIDVPMSVIAAVGRRHHTIQRHLDEAVLGAPATDLTG
jgi:hypothetical protein